jgi:hypothetical protein
MQCCRCAAFPARGDQATRDLRVRQAVANFGPVHEYVSENCFVDIPSSPAILFARQAIGLGWRPAAVRPYVRHADADSLHLVDSAVWEAMREILHVPCESRSSGT